MSQLKLLFLSTREKEFFIFDAKKRQLVLDKRLQLKTTNKILYSQKFQAVFMITQDTNVPVLKLDYPEDTFELNFIGRLVGHLNPIMSGDFIEALGILATVDERVIIKFWDVQRMCCLKTVEIQGKAHVKNLIVISQQQKLVLVSKKINMY